ncbi:hypothetical protein ACNOYE_34840 [Nannocystaceae bacterium ST9]
MVLTAGLATFVRACSPELATEVGTETETWTETGEPIIWCCYCRAGTPPPGESLPCESSCIERPSSGCPEFEPSFRCIGPDFEAPDRRGSPECPDGEPAERIGEALGCPSMCIEAP